MIKNYFSILSKLALTALLTAGMLSTANATTYTAIASGNFSNSLIWGAGTGPVGLIAGDVIIIPSGLVVTLDNNITINAAATLNVDGMLESGSNNSAIIMTAGNITGNGTIDVDSMSLSLVSGVTFTGDIIADHMSTWITTFNSTADVTVNTTLHVMTGLLNVMNGTFSMANNSTIVINGGTIGVGGSGQLGLTSDYDVVYEGTSSLTSLELSGSGLDDVTVNLTSGSVTLTSDVTIDGTLTLTSGNLILNSNDLTIDANGDIAAGGTGSINSDGNSSITINAMSSLNGDLRFGTGSSTVNNLTVNLGSSSSNVDLGSDLTVNGTLMLTQGSLTLNSNDLNFAVNGTFSSTGSGTIVSTSASDITITSNNNFSGGIRFSNTGNTVGDLNINLGNNSSYVSLGSDVHVDGSLNLTSGKVHTWNNDLILNAGATVTGGSNTSYVITDNDGHLVSNIATNASAMFHVGTEMNYAPSMISANTGSVSSDISVNVNDSVWSNGTAGYSLGANRSIVNNTWFISSSATAGLDLDVQLMWSAGMEVNGFNRTNSYISHYTNGNWDVAATTAATAQGSLYVMNRDNITSLSPFTVADNNAALKVNNVTSKEVATTVYPNPATDMINFTSTEKVTNVAIYDVTGRKVKSVVADGNAISVSDLTEGFYTIQLSGADFKSVQQFIKK